MPPATRSTRMWWSACTACRARGAISTCWPRALCQPARVVCPDVVGRGRSDWLADPMGYQIPQYAADMLALLAQVHQQAPITTLDWVGTSMGGLIGMGVTGQPGLPLPVPVRRLVLNDVGPAIQWQALQRIGQYLGQPAHFDSLQQAADALWELSRSFGPHTPEQWLDLSRAMVRPLPEGGLGLHYDPAIAVPFRALTQEAAAAGRAALWQLYDQHPGAHAAAARRAVRPAVARETAQAMASAGPRAAGGVRRRGPCAHAGGRRPGRRWSRPSCWTGDARVLHEKPAFHRPPPARAGPAGRAPEGVPQLIAATAQACPSRPMPWRARAPLPSH